MRGCGCEMGAGGRQALGGISRRLCCLRRVQKGLGRIITGKGENSSVPEAGWKSAGR